MNLGKNLSKKELISELVKHDIGCYRRYGLVEDHIWAREPAGFRGHLSTIYAKLKKEDIKILLKLRQKKEWAHPVGFYYSPEYWKKAEKRKNFPPPLHAIKPNKKP